MSPILQRLSQSILAFIVGFMLVSCATFTTLQTKIPTYPPHPLEPVPERVIIANAVDVKAEAYRDKKEEEFMRLIDNAMKHAAEQIESRSRVAAEVSKGGIVFMNNRDSVDAFIRSAQATHGMFVISYDAFFQQTHVDVTKLDDGSKHREAFYDIVVDMKYAIRSLEGFSFDTLVSVHRFHSSRTVLSGLLAAGPSIVSNQDDAQAATMVNVDWYLKSFFLGEETRARKLSFPKEFKEIEALIFQSNYEDAFEASKQLMASPDKKVSANAYYFCAVLAEREGDFDSAKAYLQESLARRNNPEVLDMLADYRHMPRVR